jgi:hypothetical protein
MTTTEKLIVLTLGITAISLFAGILYQAVSQIIDQRKYPPQGELFDIGGFRLHLNCVGQGTPTVIMDAGGGASSMSVPTIEQGWVGAIPIPEHLAQVSRVLMNYTPC